ncbi:uncharacterized protein LOC130667635 isoform X2 [Microplitis mediator]|uniref:uncharacterized protein LOC130667635 isoform X2 n=1 Tax=Microplitis mediator TaxID=375433 RepID=UPI0025561018|nr:uncharacterized protein LOC130667635 isoform X2 [Microplitis mediator]
MVYPVQPADSSNRSYPNETYAYCQTQSPSIFLNQPQQQPQQQQQQQLIYTHYNSIPTCTTSTIPQYITHTRKPGSLNIRDQDNYRGIKNQKLNTKTVRIKELSGPIQPLAYAPPPLVIYDPVQNHISSPLTPVYFSQSSCFNHAPYPSESYGNYNHNVASQPYYKTSEVQNYLIPEPKPPAQFTAVPHNYYAANVQKSVFPCSVYSNSISEAQCKAPGQLFTSSSLNLNPNGKLIPTLSIANEVTKYPEKVCQEHRLPYTETLVDSRNISKPHSKSDVRVLKNFGNEEKYSDESLNFDFTIEAEKMVSALCNTSAHEDKDEDNKAKNQDKLMTNDSESDKKKYKPWYLEEYDQETTTKSIGTQTFDSSEESTCPEFIRKTVNWGCNEAETILNDLSSSRQKWLTNLSSATKTALAKSSTCFPVFAGDKIFSQDLINSLLRISNGWLILDHYLNKQHHANLNDKYDNDLLKSFKNWEIFTGDLLENVIKTFVKLDSSSKNDDDFSMNPNMHSFPGDVSLYITYGLFGDTSAVGTKNNSPSVKSVNRSSLRNTLNDNEQKDRLSNVGRESKLRTRWTITEQTRSNDCLQKSNKPDWNLFTKELPTQIDSLNSQLSQQKLHYNFLITPEESTDIPTQFFQFKQTYESQPCVPKYTFDLTSSITESSNLIQPILTNENRTFWNSCVTPTPICNTFPYNSGSLSNLNNKMTLLSQIETKKTEVKNLNEGETINLSAWFASMRNKRVGNSSENSSNSTSNWWKSSNSISSKFREEAAKCGAKNTDSTSTLRNDINRQLRTLKNMRTIQSAPWTANHLLDDSPKTKRHDVYDSCEDLRVYMKPGSYNVPKKKYQSRRSRRDNSKSSNTKSTQSLECDVVNKSVNNASSSSSTCSQDISKDFAWKAACASAELLLDALIVKENSKIKDNETFSGLVNDKVVEEEVCEEVKVDKIIEDNSNEVNEEKINEIDYRDNKVSDVKCKLVDADSSLVLQGHQKTNVKTDSWLIRTLSNANEAKNTGDEGEKMSTEKNNDSVVLWKKDDNKERNSDFSLETSHTIAVMALVDVVGKATYSETVRRFSNSGKPCAQTTPKSDDKKKASKNLNGGLGVSDGKNESDIKKAVTVTKQEALKARIECRKPPESRKKSANPPRNRWIQIKKSCLL